MKYILYFSLAGVGIYCAANPHDVDGAEWLGACVGWCLAVMMIGAMFDKSGRVLSNPLVYHVIASGLLYWLAGELLIKEFFITSTILIFSRLTADSKRAKHEIGKGD